MKRLQVVIFTLMVVTASCKPAKEMVGSQSNEYVFIVLVHELKNDLGNVMHVFFQFCPPTLIEIRQSDKESDVFEIKMKYTTISEEGVTRIHDELLRIGDVIDVLIQK